MGIIKRVDHGFRYFRVMFSRSLENHCSLWRRWNELHTLFVIFYSILMNYPRQFLLYGRLSCDCDVRYAKENGGRLDIHFLTLDLIIANSYLIISYDF